MNQKDRDRMARLYSCMASLPWPNSGSTMTPRKLAQFHANMEDLIRPFLCAIMAISRCDVEDPDEELDDLEYVLAESRGKYEEG